MAGPGIEPETSGSSVRCTTNPATQPNFVNEIFIQKKSVYVMYMFLERFNKISMQRFLPCSPIYKQIIYGWMDDSFQQYFSYIRTVDG